MPACRDSNDLASVCRSATWTDSFISLLFKSYSIQMRRDKFLDKRPCGNIVLVVNINLPVARSFYEFSVVFLLAPAIRAYITL